jgi:hypothetical protein
MRRSTLAAVVLLLAPLGAQADSLLPFGRDWAGDAKLPKPYGVGVDVFTMNQDYDIESLSFVLPGVTLPDPNVIGVKNRLHEEDIKFDAWIFPFLNAFALVGHVNAKTLVDLSGAQAPVPLGTLPVSYDGEAYGGGLTLAYGGEHWFAAVTGTYVDTDLEGDFAIRVHSTAIQPRAGWVINDQWTVWGGAMYLDVSEHIDGDIVLGPLGSVPFDVVLQQSKRWNPAAGVRAALGDSFELNFEVGGGGRTTTLLNVTYRFE